MRSVQLLLWLMVVLLWGCGDKKQQGTPSAGGRSQTPCPGDLACPQACSERAPCAAGEQCTRGFCERPPPTASTYLACSLDSDCPRGDYCSLGACTHDCVSDRDCTSGSLCTSRGQCAEPQDVGQPPPITPPPPAALGVSTGSLELGLASPQGNLVVTNTGGAPLSFRVLSNVPWLSVEPGSGTVSGQPLVLTVRADTARTGGDSRATLRINSTGGTATVDVSLPRNLSGIYAGEVRMQEPFPLAASSLELHLFESAGSAGLTGYVEASHSLLYPFKAAVTGKVEGENVTLTFFIAGAPGSAVNPHYPRPIQRTVTLTGRLRSGGFLEGQVVESLSGPYEQRQIPLRGTFQLQYSGPPVEGQAEPTPSLSFPAVTDPFTTSGYQFCETSCPDKGNCTTSRLAGDSYLREATVFYRSFREYAEGKTGNPFKQIDTACTVKSCVNTLMLRCALYHYDKALRLNPADELAAMGLLDAFEVSTDFGLLFGNGKLVAAMDAWKSAGTLEVELTPLQSALALYTFGNHGTDPNVPLGLLDPYSLSRIEANVSSSILESKDSRLTELAGDSGAGRLSYEHLRRSALAVGGALRASLELADRQHRLGRAPQARATLESAAMQAYIDLAILSSLLERAGATPATFLGFQTLFTDFELLARRYKSLVAGHNPAGYSEGYVPFRVDQAQLPRNNYQQIQSYALQVVYAGRAKGEADAARARSREFEQESDALHAQLTAQLHEYQAQLHTLCGSQDVSNCGVPGSEVGAALGEVKAALLRIQMVQQRMYNLMMEVQIEQQRAQKIAGLANTRARLILEDGKQLDALEEEQASVNAASSFFDLFGRLPGAIVGPPPGAGVFGLFSSAISSGISISGQLEINKRRNKIETWQKARVEFDRATEVLTDSAAHIRTKLLETATLELELEIARQNLLQSMDRVLGLRQRATLLQSQREYVVATQKEQARKLLHFRIQSDDFSLRAQVSFRLLMEWAWLATRALEYERNVSYAHKGKLWQARSADELNTYLIDLDIFYQQTNLGLPQSNVEVISVRDDLLDLDREARDDVTGHTYSPRERFRRFVMDPANRDVNGNLRITFMTYRPDKPIFSRAVCNDRIKSMRINLIGDNLGAGLTTAFVKLTQGGTNYLRACSGARELVAYDLSGEGNLPRVARVQAGINAPNNASGFPANTDLFARALIAGPWELVIDQRPAQEPSNAALDLSGLDDIELIIEHEAYTLQ